MTTHKKNSETLKIGGGFIVGFLVFALIAGVVYFNMRAQGTVGSPLSSAVDWHASSLNLTDVLKRAFPEAGVGGRGLVSIEESVDVIGDGTPEAFVGMGTGGASVEYIALMGMQNGTPVALRAKNIDGVVAPLQLMQGAAVLHSSDIGSVPKEGVVYQRSLSYTPETATVSSCTIEAYVWSSREQLFAYDPDASLSLQAQRCMQ